MQTSLVQPTGLHVHPAPAPLSLQGEFRWFLALSIFWSLYNMIPPSLFIFYLFKSDGIFEDFCSFCYVASFILGIGGIVCTWLVPDDYNMGQVTHQLQVGHCLGFGSRPECAAQKLLGA